MRRIVLMLTAVALIAALMAASALPATANFHDFEEPPDFEGPGPRCGEAEWSAAQANPDAGNPDAGNPDAGQAGRDRATTQIEETPAITLTPELAQECSQVIQQ